MKKNTRPTLLPTVVLAILTAGFMMAEEVHVTQAEAVRAAKEKVQPEYPAMAKQLHLEGNVQIEAHISETGEVESVKPLTGNAVLMNAAVAAIKKWKFTPFTADGKPARAVADMSFNFRM